MATPVIRTCLGRSRSVQLQISGFRANSGGVPGFFKGLRPQKEATKTPDSTLQEEPSALPGSQPPATQPQRPLLKPPGKARQYCPPQDLIQRIQGLVLQTYSGAGSGEWAELPLGRGQERYRLLKAASEQLGRAVPNSQLYRMRKVQDVVEFYSAPYKREGSRFEDLSDARDLLPPNLKIRWGYEGGR
ncbi:large ribosomal subunit protein mL50-like [Acipenser ruthenus]|uniref:large ribosomal subunit protein mL50-like n=1 Tax=Acipenser ruthenus TaxID=7906 RepID=UPI0027428363|nr:large ribosomal subunit protein mL50-like [Acipenser ruthenus]